MLTLLESDNKTSGDREFTLRSNTVNVIVALILQRGLCSHTDIPLAFFSLLRVFVVAVRKFRPTISTFFLINLAEGDN